MTSPELCGILKVQKGKKERKEEKKMLLIRTENQITSLENVKSVEFIENGSGAKSNPYHYIITINYFNDDDGCYLRFDGNKVKAEETFEKILKILEEKA